MTELEISVGRTVAMCFPLCTTEVFTDHECRVVIRVTDAGGLVAEERISLTQLKMKASVLGAFEDVVSRLADVFETPSHWMAL